MELSPRTKVSEIISRYPFLKEFLIGVNPEFKLLENPFMRNTIGRIATLSKAAMIGGMDVNTLIEDLAGEIRARTGERVTVTRLDKEAGGTKVASAFRLVNEIVSQQQAAVSA